MLVAQVVIVGAVVSRTMNEAAQVLKLPAASVAVIVTVVVPRPTSVPMAGLCVTVVALQLSDATTALVKLGTAAWQLALAEPVMFVAQVVIVGAVVSRTINKAAQVLKLPATSVAVIVTVLVPRPTSVPMAGLCVTVVALQLSDATTALVKLGTAAWQLALAEPVMFVAQVVMVGAVVSRTMNKAAQVLKLPAVSVAVMVTVLVPRPTSVPMAGLCVTVGALQLSAAATALVKLGTAAWQLALAEPVMLVAH